MRKKMVFFFDKIFHTPLPPSPPKKKINKKKSLPSTHKNSFFFLTAMIYFIFWFKKEWYETVAMGLLFVFCSV